MRRLQGSAGRIAVAYEEGCTHLFLERGAGLHRPCHFGDTPKRSQCTAGPTVVRGYCGAGVLAKRRASGAAHFVASKRMKCGAQCATSASGPAPWPLPAACGPRGQQMRAPEAPAAALQNSLPCDPASLQLA